MLGIGRLRRAGDTLRAVAVSVAMVAALLVALRVAVTAGHAKAHGGASDTACSVCAVVTAPVDDAPSAPALLPPAAYSEVAPKAPASEARECHAGLADSRGPPAETQL